MERKCRLCGKPVGGPAIGKDVHQGCLDELAYGWKREKSREQAPPPEVDPTRESRIERMALRAAAGLPLFG
jgi:hypothetical protein